MAKTIIIKDIDGNRCYPKTIMGNVNGLNGRLEVIEEAIGLDPDTNHIVVLFTGYGTPSPLPSSYGENLKAGDLYYSTYVKELYYCADKTENEITWERIPTTDDIEHIVSYILSWDTSVGASLAANTGLQTGLATNDIFAASLANYSVFAESLANYSVFAASLANYSVFQHVLTFNDSFMYDLGGRPWLNKAIAETLGSMVMSISAPAIYDTWQAAITSFFVNGWSYSGTASMYDNLSLTSNFAQVILSAISNYSSYARLGYGVSQMYNIFRTFNYVSSYYSNGFMTYAYAEFTKTLNMNSIGSTKTDHITTSSSFFNHSYAPLFSNAVSDLPKYIKWKAREFNVTSNTTRVGFRIGSVLDVYVDDPNAHLKPWYGNFTIDFVKDMMYAWVGDGVSGYSYSEAPICGAYSSLLSLNLYNNEHMYIRPGTTMGGPVTYCY